MSRLSEVSLRIVVNGTDHSFQREIGCRCGRCLNPYFRGNTSVSLLAVVDYDEVAWHGLIDAGAGAINNLWANLYAHRREPRVDALFLTHWHPDHTLGLNQLCEGLKRSRARQGLPETRIPWWCRADTQGRVATRHPYEVDSFLEPFRIVPESEEPGRLLEPLSFPDLRITVQPVTISNTTAGPHSTAGFVITGPTGRRAGLLWDLDDQNDWIIDPSPSTADARRLLHGLDVLFMDCNTWEVESVGGRTTGHIGFVRLQRYATALQPRETVLIHLSGHEDGPGNPRWGWSNEDCQLQARRQWRDGPGYVSVLNPGAFRVL